MRSICDELAGEALAPELLPGKDYVLAFPGDQEWAKRLIRGNMHRLRRTPSQHRVQQLLDTYRALLTISVDDQVSIAAIETSYRRVSRMARLGNPAIAHRRVRDLERMGLLSLRERGLSYTADIGGNLRYACAVFTVGVPGIIDDPADRRNGLECARTASRMSAYEDASSYVRGIRVHQRRERQRRFQDREDAVRFDSLCRLASGDGESVTQRLGNEDAADNGYDPWPEPVPCQATPFDRDPILPPIRRAKPRTFRDWVLGDSTVQSTLLDRRQRDISIMGLDVHECASSPPPARTKHISQTHRDIRAARQLYRNALRATTYQLRACDETQTIVVERGRPRLLPHASSGALRVLFAILSTEAR